MIPELRYELLCFHTRDDLERLQPLSQALLNIIVARANVLPLRTIYRVNMGFFVAAGGKIEIFVDYVKPEPDYKASIDDGDFAETFRRLQHTCVRDFNVGIRDSPFMRYWKAEETAAFTVMSIDFRLENDRDYAVLDSIVNRLRPKTISEVGYNGKYLELLARESFLKNLHTCRLAVWHEAAFPAPSFILKEPGYRNYEIDCMDCNVANGLDGFIESFVRDGCANKKLQSVCIKWDGRKNQQSLALKQLCKPTKINMPLPKNDLTGWFSRVVHRVSRCEMRSVVIAKHRKRMEVFKWSVVYDVGVRHRAAHVLQFRVENL